MKYLLIFLVITIFLITTGKWGTCHGLKDDFYTDKYKIRLKIDDAIHNDKNVGFNIIRILHNKPLYYLTDLSKKYLNYFDIRFLYSFLSIFVLSFSIVGLAGTLTTVKNSRILMFFLSLAVVFPLIEIFIRPKILLLAKIYIFSMPFLYFAINGIMDSGKRIKNRRLFWELVIFTILVSLIMGNIFQKDIYIYCY